MQLKLIKFTQSNTNSYHFVYFQDDGSRQERYSPYSANSGFYYVRQNGRTKHLFRHLLYSGDLINAWYSHQQVLIALLAEYSSLFGLSVKILAKGKCLLSDMKLPASISKRCFLCKKWRSSLEAYNTIARRKK